jgi:hypothetical protein
VNESKKKKKETNVIFTRIKIKKDCAPGETNDVSPKTNNFHADELPNECGIYGYSRMENDDD